MKNKGESHEDVKHTEIYSKNGVKVIAGQGIVVEYRDTGSLTDSLDQLQDKPGLEWMQALRDNPNVDWRAIAEAHDSWSSSYEGLTGAGTAIIALAVAVATYGAGSSLLGLGAAAVPEGAVATTAVAETTLFGSTGVVTVAAANAAFTSICAQAAISLANNKGNLGAVFKDLMSEAAVRSLATSVLTASIIAGVNASFFSSDAVASTTDQATTIGDHISNVVADIPGAIQQGVVNGAISGAVDTAINGGDLGENVLGSVQSAVVSEIGASAATEIGVAYHNGDINKAAQYIAHAALGGAMDKALGGDGVSGAVGAVVGEATGDLLFEMKQVAMKKEAMKKAAMEEFAHGILANPAKVEAEKVQIQKELREFRNTGINIAALVAGISAALIGKDVNLAAMTGKNAAENNAICGGICIAAAAAAIWGAYAAVQGEGNIVDGVRLIGAGEDSVSKAGEAVARWAHDGLIKAGEVAYEFAPEQSEWALEQLSKPGKQVDAIVTYAVNTDTGRIVTSVADDAAALADGAVEYVAGPTIKFVSTRWSSLSEDDKNLIKGLGSGVNFVLTMPVASPLLKYIGSSAKTAWRVEKAADAIAEVRRVEAVVGAAEATSASTAGKIITAEGTADAVTAVKFNSQLVAEEVANGHAFTKHVLNGGEFKDLGIETRQQFKDFVEAIVNNPSTQIRHAVDATAYYLDESTKTIVIRGVRGEATAFRPDFGGGVGWDVYTSRYISK